MRVAEVRMAALLGTAVSSSHLRISSSDIISVVTIDRQKFDVGWPNAAFSSA